MKIRESSDGDTQAITALHLEAFGESEGEEVSRLAADLLKDASAQPMLSLVADDNGLIVGNEIFSLVSVDGATSLSAAILAPLAVQTGYQGKGVGSQLVEQGLDVLRSRKVDLVLVLGDPAYYSRFGFHRDHKLQPPYELPYPEAWMVKELKEGVLQKAEGKVRCAESLMSPEYW